VKLKLGLIFAFSLLTQLISNLHGVKKMKRTALTIALIALSGSANAGLLVTDTNDGNTLTNTILGSGVTISNIFYTGTETQAGTFTNGLSGGIGISDGIVLTTGTAQTAAMSNTTSGYTVNLPGGGDADLNAITSPYATQDANVLEFDFTTTTGDLFFNYVFASEEYNEYVNSQFNDAFALFVDGVNIAIAPDGNPVTINNVNCGNPYSGVGPNCSSFNNNESGIFDIQYDGFTDVFTAEILGLSAGTHTMKFAIADTSDGALDSAVFIQAGSFSGTDPGTVPEPTTLALFGMGLLGLASRRRKNRCHS
jgi:hypothetical protein